MQEIFNPTIIKVHFESVIREVNKNQAAYSQIRLFRLQNEEFDKTPKEALGDLSM